MDSPPRCRTRRFARKPRQYAVRCPQCRPDILLACCCNCALARSPLALLFCSIPEVVGDALGYELTGNTTKLSISNNFYEIVTKVCVCANISACIDVSFSLCVPAPSSLQHHSYATGGSSDGEMWGSPDLIGDYLDDRTEESCTTYNVLKVRASSFPSASSAIATAREPGLDCCEDAGGEAPLQLNCQLVVL
jgi:hypothetical protein